MTALITKLALADAGGLHVEPATPARWEDLTAVFGTRGDAAACWCQWFTDERLPLARENVEANRAGLERRVHDVDAPPAGVLAYQDETPIGWLRIGPLRELPRLLNGRGAGPALQAVSEGWMASCFVVKVGYRRRGVSGVLLDGGLALAREHGARVVVGAPLDVASLSSRPHAGDLYTGTLSTFLRAGFTEFARSTPHRALVRLDL